MARRKGVKGARSWLGTMLVAWTFVSGAALVIATAYYHRTQDLRLLITWLAPPFLIGTVLLGSIALVSIFGAVRETEVEVVNHTGTRQSIFRER